MPDLNQLPHLVNLLDDESEDIREEIARQLLTYGPSLKEEIAKLPPSLVQTQKGALDKILVRQQRDILWANWPAWGTVPASLDLLERTLSVLSNYLNSLSVQPAPDDLKIRLDQLAEAYRAQAASFHELGLASFLFQTQGLRGEEEDYYHPQNSNLLYVLSAKRGLPISLVCIYILVGARLGFRIEGYNFPGHFMAKIRQGEREFLVDCFNGGKTIPLEDVVRLPIGETDSDREGTVRIEPVDLIRRVLHNLVNAFQMADDAVNQQLMVDLYRRVC